MRKPISLIACFIVCVVIFQYRGTHMSLDSSRKLKVTDWDCLGYYMFLPGMFIYDDITQLKWLPEIDAKYSVIGGHLYQAGKCDNGNYVGKYLLGVAMIEAPFFLAAHFIAVHCGYPPDGFSPPYQYAIAFAAMFYALLSIFLLRKLLLDYFPDLSVAISICLICLATNFIQYVAVDGGMSHAYIFPLYVLLLYSTKKWHERPSYLWAGLTGYIISLACLCRPTEAVMLFIPLMWNTQSKEAAKAKWTLVRNNKGHVLFAALFCFLGVVPQLLYWKITSGSWLYDVGSSWDFLNPHLQVLFGWEKGWFIYTPVTLFFIIGMFFMKRYPFRESVLWFCILNIYILISWRDWQYAGSFSARALMESLPVFALPLAAVVEQINLRKWRWFFYLPGLYLIIVNIFQHDQYHKTILHYFDMNRQYYGRIYLNPNPRPLDMSMLDNKDMLNDTKGYTINTLLQTDVPKQLKFKENAEGTLFDTTITSQADNVWILVTCTIKADKGYWGAYLNTTLTTNDTLKHNRVRIFNPISKEGDNNEYQFYVRVPKPFNDSHFRLYISDDGDFAGVVEKIKITELIK